MTFGYGYDTPSDHKQYLREVGTSTVSLEEKHGPNTKFALFLPATLTLPE